MQCLRDGVPREGTLVYTPQGNCHIVDTFFPSPEDRAREEPLKVEKVWKPRKRGGVLTGSGAKMPGKGIQMSTQLQSTYCVQRKCSARGYDSLKGL